MIRVTSTGIFLNPDDLDTVQAALFVARRCAAHFSEGAPLDDLFTGQANAQSTLARFNAFEHQLRTERSR